jgi:hypothetical protein
MRARYDSTIAVHVVLRDRMADWRALIEASSTATGRDLGAVASAALPRAVAISTAAQIGPPRRMLVFERFMVSSFVGFGRALSEQ